MGMEEEKKHDIERWITSNHARVPVYVGQTPAEAIAEHKKRLEAAQHRKLDSFDDDVLHDQAPDSPAHKSKSPVKYTKSQVNTLINSITKLDNESELSRSQEKDFDQKIAKARQMLSSHGLSEEDRSRLEARVQSALRNRYRR